MDKMEKLPDERLVSLFKDGNNDAFDILVKRYESKVFTYIFYSVKKQETAEDIFQETFVKAVVAIKQGRYTENGKFSSWIMRISHNALLDYYRQVQSESLVSNDESEVDLFNDTSLAVNDNMETSLVDKQTLADVRFLITQLPENQRQVVLMRYYQDMSFKEIADTTGVSINTALGRMRYALINLRRLAREYDVCMAG
jgi:RNA polymerase sigma-70 factor (ECF subfamily)